MKVSLLANYLGVGVVVGLMSGLLGVGGGIIMVPVITLLWHKPIHVAIGTSLAVMVPTAIAGALRHSYSYHSVDFTLAAMMAVGAIVGSYFLGAPLSNHLPGATLQKVFGVTMVIFGVYYAWLEPWLTKLGQKIG